VDTLAPAHAALQRERAQKSSQMKRAQSNSFSIYCHLTELRSTGFSPAVDVIAF
jgi:hypothetical protein